MAMSWGNDLSTIMAAFQQNSTGPIKDMGDAAQSDLSGGHCSGFVRVLPDNEDVYFSHDTWSSFNSMMRVYKLYDMPCVRSIATHARAVCWRHASCSPSLLCQRFALTRCTHRRLAGSRTRRHLGTLKPSHRAASCSARTRAPSTAATTSTCAATGWQ